MHILEQLFIFLELAGEVRIIVLIDSLFQKIDSVMVLVHCPFGEKWKKEKKIKKKDL